MNITPHFTLEDMTHSDNAIRHGIANTASPEIIANLTRLCGVLEKFRSYIGHPIKVSSGYRNHAVNQLAGSSDTSAHTKGLAADIEVDGISPKSLCKLFVIRFNTNRWSCNYNTIKHISCSFYTVYNIFYF